MTSQFLKFKDLNERFKDQKPKNLTYRQPVNSECRVRPMLMIGRLLRLLGHREGPSTNQQIL